MARRDSIEDFVALMREIMDSDAETDIKVRAYAGARIENAKYSCSCKAGHRFVHRVNRVR